MTKIYGHRGAKGNYPENTLLAFKKAIEAGVDGLEFDIHLTKDGEVVVIHDATLERTTTGMGYIKDYTMAELEHFSAGAKFNEYKNYASSWDKETIPTLETVLTLCKSHQLEINIELKTYQVLYPQIEEKMLAVIKKVGYDESLIVYSSFHFPTLWRIKQLNQKAKIAWLLEHPVPFPMDYADTFDMNALHLDKTLVLANEENWKHFGSRLRVWTVNEVNDMKKMIDLGVAALITDYPEEAVLLVKDLKKI